MTDLQSWVAPTLEGLADLLAAADAETWDAPSLCEKWQVRHVVAHVTMAARYDEERFGAELAANGFDFRSTSDRLARRDGGLPPEALLDDLRSDRLATFEQPGGGWLGSVSHVVIHGLDVTLPLGLGRVAGDEATRLVLDGLVSPGDRTVFGVEIGARRAEDLDWAYGTGPAPSASAGALVAVLSGRDVPH